MKMFTKEGKEIMADPSQVELLEKAGYTKNPPKVKEAVEKTTVEDTVEEAPVEEAPVEEAPVEEAPKKPVRKKPIKKKK